MLVIARSAPSLVRAARRSNFAKTRIHNTQKNAGHCEKRVQPRAWLRDEAISRKPEYTTHKKKAGHCEKRVQPLVWLPDEAISRKQEYTTKKLVIARSAQPRARCATKQSRDNKNTLQKSWSLREAPEPRARPRDEAISRKPEYTTQKQKSWSL